MTRVLLITPRYRGHLYPLVGVAQWLRRLGSAVDWLTISGPDIGDDDVGFEMISLFDPPVTGTPIGGPDWFDENLRKKAARVPRIREVIRARRPDVVAMDLMDESIISARLESVVYATVSVSLELVAPASLECQTFDNQRRFVSARERFFAEFGQQPELWNFNMISPWLNTVFTTQAFIGDDVELPPRTELVGPSFAPEGRGDETDFPWERLAPDRPLVYVAFGSSPLFGRSPMADTLPGLYRAIVEAALPLGVQLVLSVGTLVDHEEIRALPDEVIAVPYTPQLQVLQRAAVFVTHGGCNSISDALHQGVPSLVLPMCFDQPIQAYFVEKAGVGCSLDLSHATVSGLRARLVDLLRTNDARSKALARIRRSFRSHDGAQRVARSLIALASSPRTP